MPTSQLLTKAQSRFWELNKTIHRSFDKKMGNQTQHLTKMDWLWGLGSSEIHENLTSWFLDFSHFVWIFGGFHPAESFWQSVFILQSGPKRLNQRLKRSGMAPLKVAVKFGKESKDLAFEKDEASEAVDGRVVGMKGMSCKKERGAVFFFWMYFVFPSQDFPLLWVQGGIHCQSILSGVPRGWGASTISAMRWTWENYGKQLNSRCLFQRPGVLLSSLKLWTNCQQQFFSTVTCCLWDSEHQTTPRRDCKEDHWGSSKAVLVSLRTKITPFDWKICH